MIYFYWRKLFQKVSGFEMVSNGLITFQKTPIQFRTDTVADRTPQVQRTVVKYRYTIGLDCWIVYIKITFESWDKKQSL